MGRDNWDFSIKSHWEKGSYDILKNQVEYNSTKVEIGEKNHSIHTAKFTKECSTYAPRRIEMMVNCNMSWAVTCSNFRQLLVEIFYPLSRRSQAGMKP